MTVGHQEETDVTAMTAYHDKGTSGADEFCGNDWEGVVNSYMT